MSEKKVLCFTTSFKRYKMLRGCIRDIANQTYENIFHSVNITYTNALGFEYQNNKQKKMEFIFDDLKTEKNKFIFSENSHQHINHIKAITSVENFEDYDLFVKIDDDDIYKKDYVKTIVEVFETNNYDVITSKINYQLNGGNILVGDYSNLGGNPNNCHFNMPMTFAFNKKALKLIIDLNKMYGYEDHMWRDIWCKNCKIGEYDNTKNIIWHIHGKNISTADFLIKD
jgi:hypothetical protein